VRILYLANPEPDYLQDAVYHGLTRLLGPENVVEHPVNERYHRPAPAGSVHPMLYFDLSSPPRGELEDVVAGVDAIVIASLRDGVIDDVRRVLALGRRPPTAFVDGDDHPYVRGVFDEVDVYFKAEVLSAGFYLQLRMPVRRRLHALRGTEFWRDPLRRQIRVATVRSRGVVPLPFGLIDVGIEPAPEKEFDVAFISRPYNPERIAVAAAADSLRRSGFRVFLGTEEPVSWQEYIEVLRRTRIGLNARGLGRNTYRYWEIPSAGAVLASQPPGIVIPDDLVHGREALLVSVDELETVTRAWLERDTAELAEAGRQKVLSSHTSVNRAERVLDHLERARKRR
jgi:hypothetical protein